MPQKEGRMDHARQIKTKHKNTKNCQRHERKEEGRNGGGRNGRKERKEGNFGMRRKEGGEKKGQNVR